MFLKQLLIESKEGTIRDIAFHKGINLILDYTDQNNKTKSGNNVGKTTVLKLVDFCFGGKPQEIYLDPEFKQPNVEVENFLKDEEVIITLTLGEDLDSNTNTLTIRRNFLSRAQKIQEINGENETSDKNFQAKLKELIFNSKEIKPTFRQIIAKNIRDDANRVKNTLKVLHTTTKQEEYESLYLFWLGVVVDSGERKQQLLSLQKTEENLQKRLKKEKSLPQINQSLILINKEIENLKRKKIHIHSTPIIMKR